MRRWESVSAGSVRYWDSEQDGEEDALEIPASWLSAVDPRRGGAPCPAVELESVGTQGEERPCGSTPEEAAALALAAMPGTGDELWLFVDTWVGERGIPFAAAATASLGRGRSYAGEKARFGAFLRMRRHLVAAGDADYAEAVRGLDGFRTDFASRFIVSYLVPTETVWADRACGSYWSQVHTDFERWLAVGTVSTPRQLSSLGHDLLVRRDSPLRDIATLIDGAGLAALPALVQMLDGGGQNRPLAIEAVSRFPCDEAFEALTARLDAGGIGRAVVEAMERFPVRALRLLAKAANGGGGQRAQIARTLLTQHIRAHIALVDDALPKLPEPDAKLISLLVQENVVRPDATPETEPPLPPLLVAPPWARARGGKRAERAEPAVIGGLEPPRERRIDWAPGEREKWSTTDSHDQSLMDWSKTAGEFASRDSGSSGNGHWMDARFFAQAPDELARPLLARWRPDLRYWSLVEMLGPVLTRFGADAFDAVLAAAATAGTANAGQVLQPLVDLELARMMADWYTRLKSGRAPAVAWLTRHAQAAAGLLIPDAVGEPGERRTAARNALRLLASLTDVPAAAAAYGPEAADAVAAVLAFDPLDLHPRRMPALPAWLASTRLPQILLRDNEYALPDEAVRHVLSMLTISKPGEPYAGIAVVRECADPASLAGFAWELFESWRNVDMPSKDGWVLTTLGWFGDDEAARKLAPLIRAWPGEGGHQRAVAGLEVLAELGTDTALIQLHQISQRVKFKALKARAQEKIEEIARSLELTPDQLGDRLVPDLGLDAGGGLSLDYGPRRFRVGFDEQLRPFVIAEESGARRKDLPAPTTKDDAELAAAARKQFSALKKDVRTIAADAIRRLEAAMVAGRLWTPTEFRELLVGHPLIGHLTRRLVWLSECGGDAAAGTAPVATTFRVAEDQTLATVDDEEFRLPEDASVRLPHPLYIPGALDAWGEIFADYEIVQPFAQLGRPVYELTAPEREGSRLSRFEGRTVPIGRVLGLVARGWRRGEPMDGGVEVAITRKVSENVHLIVELDPGIVVGAVDEFGDQTLREVYLDTHPNGYWSLRDGSGPRFGSLDAVTASELLGDLARLEE